MRRCAAASADTASGSSDLLATKYSVRRSAVHRLLPAQGTEACLHHAGSGSQCGQCAAGAPFRMDTPVEETADPLIVSAARRRVRRAGDVTPRWATAVGDPAEYNRSGAAARNLLDKLRSTRVPRTEVGGTGDRCYRPIV